jgi:hypothetical protein
VRSQGGNGNDESEEECIDSGKLGDDSRPDFWRADSLAEPASQVETETSGYDQGPEAEEVTSLASSREEVEKVR